MNAASRSVLVARATGAAPRTGLLQRIWHRRVLFAAVFGMVLAMTAIALVVLPVRYLASGSVIVAEPEPALSDSSSVWSQKIGDPADLESQLLVIRSPRVMRLAMTAPGVVDAAVKECRYRSRNGGFTALLGAKADTCSTLASDSDSFIEYVTNRYLVTSAGRSRVINISYQSPLPDVAQTMANALTTAFLDDQKSTMSNSRKVAADWLWKELNQLDAELRDEDAKIQDFRRTKGLMRGATAPINSERLTSISQQLSAAEAARADADAKLQEIRADQARGSSDAPAVLASRAVADLKQQLTTLAGQLAQASVSLGPKHPTLLGLQQQVNIVQERLAREVASIAASEQKDFEAADMLVASLQKQMDGVKTEVAAATSDEASIESMVRSVEIKRQQYVDLYKRASELETDRRVLLGGTRLVSLAELPNQPFFPKRAPFLAAGLTIAFLLAGIAAFLRDRSDRSVRDPSELAFVTGVPILAQVPELRPSRARTMLGFLSNRQSDMPLEVALRRANQDPMVQNALRKLYSGLILAAGTRAFRTILVTSAGPGEGKTFTTLALAKFVAAKDRRVLVIECDQRHSAFGSTLDGHDSPGLAGVLRGAALPRGAVVPTGIPNLDVIPAGDATLESAKLLVGESMAGLLRWAQDYDLVLLDRPSFGLAMDDCMLARLFDGVLWCARWRQSSIADAVTTIEGIRAAGGSVFGVAVTMARADNRALHEAEPTPSRAYIGAG